MINIFTIVYFFATTSPADQHFLPPIQRCILAELCNHTSVPTCGLDDKTADIRLFIDSCDMEEYNCDYKTGYKEIDPEKCKTDENCVDSTTSTDLTTVPTSSGKTSSSLISPTATSPLISPSITSSSISPSTTSSLISPLTTSSSTSTTSTTMITTPSTTLVTEPHITSAKKLMATSAMNAPIILTPSCADKSISGAGNCTCPC